MKLTDDEKRAIELSKKLTEKMKQCQQSGVDPYEHPEVRAILDEMNNLPFSGEVEDDETLEIAEAEAVNQADLDVGYIDEEDATLEAEDELEELRKRGEKPN